jgi:hypothetical protein
MPNRSRRRPEHATPDLAALEQRLHRRACFHDDQAAYRQGVADALAAVREDRARRDEDRAPSRTVLAG